MVEAARIAYRDYPTVVNRIEESGVEYRNFPSEYARMDSKMQGAQKAIGGASDSAQLAQSYYWSDIANHIWRGETQELYNNIVILAVLAQCAIDGCKREYAVDPAEDIARIRSMPCMDRRMVYEDENGKRKFKKTDYPKFMRYTRSTPMTKNGRPISADDVKENKRKLAERIDSNIVCPMNWLEETLDKIQGVNSNSKSLVDNDVFFVKKAGDTNRRQMTKIRQIVEEYDRYIRSHVPTAENDDDWEMINIQVNSFVDDLRKMKIKSEATINRIIETTLGITSRPHDSRSRQYQKASQYVSATMNLLYKMDPEKFLSNFVRGENKNARPEVLEECKTA